MELHPNSRMNRNLAGARAARRSPIISGRTFRWNRRATITGDEAWFRVDLVFFHRRLICLVIIDLKVGHFSYADAGQMHLYLNYAREHWMKPGENPPVGLILCAEKGAAEAHYALDNLPNKILAAEYQTVLPDEAMIVQAVERTTAELERRTGAA
jgi:hypothetical protein